MAAAGRPGAASGAGAPVGAPLADLGAQGGAPEAAVSVLVGASVARAVAERAKRALAAPGALDARWGERSMWGVTVVGRVAPRPVSEAVEQGAVVLEEVVAPVALDAPVAAATPLRAAPVADAAGVAVLQGGAAGAEAAAHGRVSVGAEVPGPATRAAQPSGEQGGTPPEVVVRSGTRAPTREVQRNAAEQRPVFVVARPSTQVRVEPATGAEWAGEPAAKGEGVPAVALADAGSPVPVTPLPKGVRADACFAITTQQPPSGVV